MNHFYKPIQITSDLLPPSNPMPKPPRFASNDDQVLRDIGLATQQLTAKGIDITFHYSDWVKIAFALASLGEPARIYFHQVSAISNKYKLEENEKLFDHCLDKYDGKTRIATFFHYCKVAGVDINFKSYLNTAEPVKYLNPVLEIIQLRSEETIDAVSEKEDYVFTGEELLNSPVEKIPTLWDPFFPQKGLGAFAGSSDTGKSTFLRELGIAICSGDQDFLGFPLNTRHQSAIFVLTEDDDAAIRFLLNKQNKGLQLSSQFFRNLRFIFNSEDIIAKLAKELERQPADLVVVDAFSDLYNGEMNAGNKVRAFLNEYKEKIADAHNCFVLFLHHTGKKTDTSPPSKHNLIGSQAFEAKMRVVIELRKDPHNPHIRHLCMVKGNYLEAEYKEKSYALNFDNNMLFHSTGERVPFEELATNEEEPYKKKKDDKLVDVRLAFELKKEGKKHEDIAEEIRKRNKSEKSHNKGTISKWLNNEEYQALFG